ncbi:hypothetical protein GCM10018790_10390 [Kitasatospora xanthocidica]|uniref:DUF6461 domain-containing protein n=1 Tax=Kitasatospora xanthocidica TaxID=83382 RepID=UPI0016741BE0|nr:DUF6461 domain-containing protein [Kitasatospora xanthocidica]GHF34592.1 hypothetical protein GCM10018790_10390 [Kitasatospora xanthocidica]
MTAAHATDYTWFEQRYPVLGEAYCLTQVQGIAADELLRRFDALPGREVAGLDAVVEAWETFDDGEDEEAGALLDDDDDDRLLVAVTALDGWALAVEPYGYLGSLHELVPRLAGGTRLVSHFRNVNAVDSFHWWEHGGGSRLHFEPLFADQRHGSDAEAPGIPELLTACGFDLGGERHRLHTEAAFALAERLTDVRLDEERLEAATFRIGYAPRP